MLNRTAVANGADPVQQQAASDGNAIVRCLQSRGRCWLLSSSSARITSQRRLWRSPDQSSGLTRLHEQAELALSHDD